MNHLKCDLASLLFKCLSPCQQLYNCQKKPLAQRGITVVQLNYTVGCNEVALTGFELSGGLLWFGSLLLLFYHSIQRGLNKVHYSMGHSVWNPVLIQ